MLEVTLGSSVKWEMNGIFAPDENCTLEYQIWIIAILRAERLSKKSKCLGGNGCDARTLRMG